MLASETYAVYPKGAGVVMFPFDYYSFLNVHCGRSDAESVSYVRLADAAYIITDIEPFRPNLMIIIRC